MMMKSFNTRLLHVMLYCSLHACVTDALSQNVGVNSIGATPDASAILDVYSTDKGLLVPRITLTGTTDVTSIAS